MAEMVNDRKVFSLREVMQSIQRTLSGRYATSFWVKAEMNKLNFYAHSGHCYPELLEKEHEKVIAQVRANIWKDDFIRINARFIEILKEPLKDGIKILFLATISFHEVYGLSLNISDIDPAYTLGDLEQEKQETIARLRKENLFDKNKLLRPALLPQRIAIISVETSKGYADFLKVIGQNQWDYHFFHLLFPALLQGEKAVASIRLQLQRIRKVTAHFDMVAIIRGGGGDIGLSCYNNYLLAREIALFPLPVITGIGHATNETVCELIAFQNAITPTKIAEYLLQQFHNFSVPVQQAEEKITDKAQRMVTEEKGKLQSAAKYFRSLAGNQLIQGNHAIREQGRALVQHTRHMLQQQKEQHRATGERLIREAHNLLAKEKEWNRSAGEGLRKGSVLLQQKESAALENMEKNIRNMDPKNVLRRGYSITLLNGRSVRSCNQVKEGDHIKTVLFQGTVISQVQSSHQTDDHEGTN